MHLSFNPFNFLFNFMIFVVCFVWRAVGSREIVLIFIQQNSVGHLVLVIKYYFNISIFQYFNTHFVARSNSTQEFVSIISILHNVPEIFHTVLVEEFFWHFIYFYILTEPYCSVVVVDGKVSNFCVSLWSSHSAINKKYQWKK